MSNREMNNPRARRQASLALLAMATALVVAPGCGERRERVNEMPPAPYTRPVFAPNVDAGVRVEQSQDQERIRGLVAGRSFAARRDPFALLGPEARFEREQEAFRMFDQIGGFTLVWEPPDPDAVEPVEPVEPQPYRRLSGILIGDSVLAIIELEGGRTEIVRPGMRIPNTEWTVVSIDGERAILRRPGPRRPTEISVRLESPPPGMGRQPGAGPGAPGAAGGGGPAGGGPGGGPGTGMDR
jgi:hypothetical protein